MTASTGVRKDSHGVIGPTFRIPMGPFPARFRAGESFDSLDVVVGEVRQVGPVFDAWEATVEEMHEASDGVVALPELSVGPGNPHAVIITFRARSEAEQDEFATLMAGAARFAALMAGRLHPVLIADWRRALIAEGITLVSVPPTRRLLEAELSATWPAWDVRRDL